MKSIRIGVGSEYRLTVKAREIAVDASFKELPWQLLAADLRDFLVEQCPEVTLGNLEDSGK